MVPLSAIIARPYKPETMRTNECGPTTKDQKEEENGKGGGDRETDGRSRVKRKEKTEEEEEEELRRAEVRRVGICHVLGGNLSLACPLEGKMLRVIQALLEREPQREFGLS